MPVNQHKGFIILKPYLIIIWGKETCISLSRKLTEFIQGNISSLNTARAIVYLMRFC